MPHIKVKPFAGNKLDELVSKGDLLSFRAVSKAPNSGKESNKELLGLVLEGERFALELHKRDGEYLIKAEKSTRPLDANKIKRALRLLAQKADLEIMHENISLSTSKPSLAEEYNKSIGDFENIDFGGRKIAVEVGFGSGRHLLYQAKANPYILHIGIEIHTPSAQQVLKQINLQGIDNIWVVNYDARLLLEMLPSNAAKMIYVHFPVPWDKKPHRRVISRNFVDEALRVLDQGGALELRTDSDKYYRYALEVFSTFHRAHFEVRKNSEAVIRSKYEERWQRQDKDIYNLTLFSYEISVQRQKDYIFDFDGKIKQSDDLWRLPLKSIVKDDHFVHFGKRYEINQGAGALIECSFGSFDRPEHKLIMIDRVNASYYPQPPVKTSSNYKAHQIIGEYIYV